MVRFIFSFIIILHLPIVFAKADPVGKDDIIFKHLMSRKQAAAVSVNGTEKKNTGLAEIICNLYDSLGLNKMGLSIQAFSYAYKGFRYLDEIGKLRNNHILTVIDFTKPSDAKRLFILDFQQMKVLFNTYVAHGMNSGKEFATRFSNRPESNQSSLGFYETENTYDGKNGYSLRLNGLESGFNSNAYSREIVVHGADYVNEQQIWAKGFLGRSWGCPAVPRNLCEPIINEIKNGTCLFIYRPEKGYLSHSPVLRKASV